ALQQRLGAPVQFLSSHNPKAPVVDLEALDLEPRKLLVELGKRLVRVARAAYEWEPGDKAVQANLDKLAATVAQEQLEVRHRRRLVKLGVRPLDQLRLGSERVLDDDEIRALVRDEQALLLVEEPEEQPRTWLGMPLDKPKKKKT